MKPEPHTSFLQVWVKPEIREDGKVYWSADSDSQLTKGLAALLVLGLSGCSPEEMRSRLQLYNTMARSKQAFTTRPETPNKVSMYVCGVTVYDFSHIGEH